MAGEDSGCCPGGSCQSEPVTGGLTRRTFLSLSAAGVTTAMLASRAEAAEALGRSEDDLVLVPADKGLDPDWVASLAERGEPTVYSDPTYIGMPVGGGCSGQLYLGGDGRLWRWDVYNGQARATSDRAYAHPAEPHSPFGQGFVLRTHEDNSVRTLDAGGFDSVSFTGQYPVGTVDYSDDSSPVRVRLEAFSPFVPLDVDDSTLPATVLAYTLHNTGSTPVRADVLGWSKSPVCLDSRNAQPITLTSQASHGRVRGAQFGALERDLGEPRKDIVLEDWERDDYSGWTMKGDAFGSGPVLESDLPDYMRRYGDLHVEGKRLVTSHRFEDGDTGQADAHTGSLTSEPFTVERRYLHALVGGGSAEGKTCVQVLVDGKVVGTVTGDDTEPLARRSVDLSRYEGKRATIRIVDAATGGWGHVNVDTLALSDKPADPKPLSELPDHGTFALAALTGHGVHATVRPSIGDWSKPAELFTAPDGPDEVDGGRATLTATVTASVEVPPGGSRTVRFVVGWYFPVPDRHSLSFLDGADTLRRRYGERFASAREVTEHVGHHLDRLERQTKLWVDTWYESSTLPHWLLERVMASASTIATSTCYQFAGGRFYGWEGVYCCPGTCEHVWNYAQAVARLFPSLERDTRERVDLGIGFHADTGEMGNRAEADMGWAADGQCGTILRIYREHQTAPDDTFLRTNWPRIKKALRYLFGRDGEPDGIFEGAQPNTLDSVWYGEIAWISGMYVAALHAGARMAEEVGDARFAKTCRRLAKTGSRYLDTKLWTGEYFIQRVDPDHPEAINSNRGCHIDQLLGQSLAFQLGLPRVFDEKKTNTALNKLYRYNFSPDPAQYRDDHPAIPGGRWFAMADEPALLMTTWPHGGAEQAPGDGPAWAAGYFNEAWTGQEHQVASHLMAEGQVDRALTVTRAVHDRYAAAKRNPYNEVECGEHYARAMAAYGTFLATCGFEYHGPAGHIGFAPRLTPKDFRAAFTAAEGWGLYRQERTGAGQESALEVRYGSVALRTVALGVSKRPASVDVRVGHRRIPAELEHADGRVTVRLHRRTTVREGETLRVTLRP